jgi:hypothetical protein
MHRHLARFPPHRIHVRCPEAWNERMFDSSGDCSGFTASNRLRRSHRLVARISVPQVQNIYHRVCAQNRGPFGGSLSFCWPATECLTRNGRPRRFTTRMAKPTSENPYTYLDSRVHQHCVRGMESCIWFKKWTQIHAIRLPVDHRHRK